MKVYNVSRNLCLADSVIMADSFFLRLKGLLGKSGLPEGCCMVLKPCRSIHTMFMRFSLDVLFLDRQNRVLAMVSDMPPFRFSKSLRQAYMVMEFPAGSLISSGTLPGDRIQFLTSESTSIHNKN